LTLAGWKDRLRAGGNPVRSLSVPRASARVTFLTGLVLLAASSAHAAPASALRPAAPSPTQELVTLFAPHKALSKPTLGSALIELVPARRPITEVRTVLPVLGHRTGRGGLRWLRIRLPGRPNGRTGWIRRRATLVSRTPWHIVINTSSRRVKVYRHGRQVRVFSAIVGNESTPTPVGEFFVEESIKLSARAIGAPFALALSARSTVYQEFAGGPGQIALHGLNNVGGTLGTAVSHGCVRLNTAAMRWLAARIAPGIPVTIKR
jgi:lipoprotein-anchoring transpeptidase ErfK/SrfK